MSLANRDKSRVELFVDDDEGYLNWLDAHPNGLVVNAYKARNPGYLKLHHAACGSINPHPRRDVRWTTSDFAKTCSMDLDALTYWSWQAHGGLLSPCGNCHRKKK